MTTVIRSMDYGEGGPDYRIHFDVTYAGCPAKLYGPPERCYPAEGPEWEITGIDGELCDGEIGAYAWAPIEQTHDKLQIESVYGWAEMLDLSDECAEAVGGERDAWREQQAESRADALAEMHRERNER